MNAIYDSILIILPLYSTSPQSIVPQTSGLYFLYIFPLSKYLGVKTGAERGWLLAVAKNLLTDDFRKKKLRLIDHTQIEESETEYCYEVDMAKEVSRKDFLRQILTELEEKNQDWYDAVYKVCMLNLPMADVAAQKNISIDLLRARLCRGRQFLKQRFGEEYQELK